jgi:hypothetical protein
MGEAVLLEPLEHNMRWLKHSVTLHPAEELWIDLEMLVGVSPSMTMRAGAVPPGMGARTRSPSFAGVPS